MLDDDPTETPNENTSETSGESTGEASAPAAPRRATRSRRTVQMPAPETPVVPTAEPVTAADASETSGPSAPVDPPKAPTRKRTTRKTIRVGAEPDPAPEPAQPELPGTAAAMPVFQPPVAPEPRKRSRKRAEAPETTETTETATAGGDDAAPAKKTAAKKSAAKKTAAKKTAAKKTAAKKAAAPVEGEPETETQAETPAEPEASDAPAKRAGARKSAKKTTAKKSGGGRKKADVADETADETPEESPEEADATAPVVQDPEAETAPTDEQPDDQPADQTDDDSDGDQGDDQGDDGGPRRRRRRGGRRRRRSGDGGGSGEADGDSDGSGDGSGEAAQDQQGGSGTAEKDSDDDEQDDSDDASGSGGSRRRRRRRRGGGSGGGGNNGSGGSGGGGDRGGSERGGAARAVEDEIASITGSTRLEAKRQRRKEGREAGRRRAPIVSEAEFLARREAVERVMVIRQREDLTQIAVLEDDVLVEHYVARESQTSLIGNVYLGRVQNVLPSMEAAFVDIGKGRNAVIYAGEVNWQALGHKDGQPRKIESVLSSGQSILVQVTKDPIGHKGARLTGQISLPGRFLVYVPEGSASGISRKLPDTERNRLKSLLKQIVPDGAGVIVRTAAEGASEEELTQDVERLTARWEDIAARAGGSAPQLLYGEPDLTLKVVRDLFTEDFARLVVEGDDAWDLVDGYVAHVAPDLRERLSRHEPETEGPRAGQDAFAAYRIDEQIAKGLDRKVWLPSGGSLVIDRTEAMTVVDVNTGKFTGSGGNLEETVTKNNLEAAEEMVRQLRLRDIGGIIVIDFIDMVMESNRDLVLRRLVECLGRDRTRHQVAEVTSLGLVQMTRKRIGTGLLEAFSTDCEHCKGRGLVTHEHPVEPSARADDGGRGGRGGNGGGNGGSAGGGRGRGRGGKASRAESEPVAASVPSPAALAHTRPPEPGDEPTPEPVAESAPEPAPEPVVESAPEPAGEPSQDPFDPAPRIVATSRRRSARRPAGPPAAPADQPADASEDPVDPQADEEGEESVGHVPVKRRGRRR